jgi:pSer/pThr/pTyr-binding forkhead associated (FHA) protein
VSGNTEWNDANLDHTSKLSAISPSDPLEDAEPGLSSQDRRAIENLPPRSALLIVRKGPNLGARFLLDSETTVAGRHPKSEIFLDDVTVSRKHAAFVRDGDGYVGKDRVDEARLHAGQDVQIGKYRLTYHPFPGTV